MEIHHHYHIRVDNKALDEVVELFTEAVRPIICNVADAIIEEITKTIRNVAEDINHKEDEVLGRLTRLFPFIRREVQREGERVMLDFSQLEAEVAANTDAVNSVIQVVDRLADEFEAAKDDPEQVQALVDKMRANNTGIGNAVVRGTTALDTTTTTTTTPPPSP